MDPVKIRSRMDALYFLEPNDLHYAPLTRLYRLVSGQLKQHPWLRIVPVTVIGLVVVSVALSNVLVLVASVLQKGF